LPNVFCYGLRHEAIAEREEGFTDHDISRVCGFEGREYGLIRIFLFILLCCRHTVGRVEGAR
jgi:hypothetical protein